jgi:Fe-S oxidoreductase
LDIGEFSVLARHELTKAHVTPPLVQEVVSSVSHGVSRGDIFGASDTKARWAQELNLPREGETLFFASCMDSSMAYGETLLRILQSSNRLGHLSLSAGGLLQKIGFNKLFESLFSRSLGFYRTTLVNTIDSLRFVGVDLAYMHGEEPCCGIALHTYGLLDEFAEHARKVHNMLKERGVRRIITHNPICGTAFKIFYPQFIDGWSIEVKHVSEVLADEMVKRDMYLTCEKTRVTFHDPCFLARYMNVVEQPRTILKRIENLELVEPIHTKADTRCDGGGGMELLYPGMCDMIARNRVRELQLTGADKIVSCCPVCALMIKNGIRGAGVNMKYVDIVDLFCEALNRSKARIATAPGLRN